MQEGGPEPLGEPGLFVRRLMDGTPVAEGTWVELETLILRADQRAPGIPADTAATDFSARVRGYLIAPAEVGDHACVKTLAGRVVCARLRTASPRNSVDFGRPVPQLTTAAQHMADRLREMREQ